MSALDEFLSQYDNEADWVNDCRAELAQLNSTIESWIALWKYICHATNCEGYLPNEQNFDSMLDNAPRYVALRATVAEQARRLEEAREIFENIFKRDWSNGKINDKARSWLVAHPAQADEAQ